MSRPLRIQYPGAHYHVMNRGNRREDIFINETDRSRFVDALSDSCEACPQRDNCPEAF
jgi:putative transposase